MKKYTMKQIRDSLPTEKKVGDSLVALYVARPMSYPLTYFFVNIGVSAWLVSVISVAVAILGCMCFWSSSSAVRWVGCVVIFLWSVLDCVDGNVARVTKTSSEMGSFMDAESGYVFSALIYLSYGIAASKTTGILHCSNKEVFIIVGAIASICDILARLIHQRFTVSKMTLGIISVGSKGESTFTTLRKRVSAEIGIAGLVLLAGAIGEAFQIYDIFVCFYALYCCTSVAVVLGLYSVKASR